MGFKFPPPHIQHINELLRQGEGLNLDFKQTLSSMSKIACTIVAFANTNGGTLLIGVSDDKRIVGIREEEEIYMLENAASAFCQPEVPMTLIVHEIQGKMLIEAQIPESQAKPHAARDEEGKYWVYIRNEDKTLKASREMFEVMKRNSRQAPVLVKMNETETRVIKTLAEQGSVSFSYLESLPGMKKRYLSEALILLVRAGVVRLKPGEPEDQYVYIIPKADL